MSKKLIVLIILILYLVLNLYLGIRTSRRSAKENASKGFLSNYFVGSRSMGGFVLAMTLVATYTSASSFLGGPGLASSFGLTWSWVAGVQIGAAFLTLGVLGKKFAMISRRTNSVTINDYLRARYDSPAVVIVCGIAMVVFFVTQMIAQFIGGATLMQSVTGLPYWAGLLLFGAVVIIYTSVGGFKAVVTTDTIQGIVMTIGTFLMLFFIIRAAGGMDNIIGSLDAGNPGWDLMGKGEYGTEIAAMRPGALISFWVLVGVAVLGLPQTAVRCMAFRDTKSMHSAMIYGTVVIGILMLGMHLAGTFAFPLLPEGGLESTDQVIPYVVMNYMPAWAAGLFLAAPLAAVMSTVDSLLILASATIIKDLYIHYIKKVPVDAELSTAGADNEAYARVPRYSLMLTAGIGIASCLLALNPPDVIVWINLFAFGGLEATFFWPIIGGLYWKKGNSKACLASVICGLAVFIFFNRVKILPFGIHEIIAGLIASGVVYFAVGVLSKDEPDPEMLRKCF
ncbi:MAG: sodium/pantothenate symporter [Clostridiales bacterium]|nr:sodium/pantothenate symporter [Clostridiales bacterium]